MLAAAQTVAQHPVSADDWAITPTASAVAVSPDGQTLLYVVAVGGPKGPSTRRWHLSGSDGSHDRALDVPDGFAPAGFTRDGAALYGLYQVNHQTQFGVFPLDALGPGRTPTMTVMLPSGILSARLSPDGSRFLILAPPGPPDELKEVRTVVEPRETSIYVVNADGTRGAWWCPALTHVDDVAWAPDGAAIAVLSSTPKIGHHDLTSFVDVCRATGSRHVADLPNAASGVAWADGGRTLVFLEYDDLRHHARSRVDGAGVRRRAGGSHARARGLGDGAARQRARSGVGDGGARRAERSGHLCRRRAEARVQVA